MKKFKYLFVAILFGLMVTGPVAAQNAATDQPGKKPLPQGVLDGASVNQPTEDHHGKSADEVAKELANPNNSLASLTCSAQNGWLDSTSPRWFPISLSGGSRECDWARPSM